MQTIANFEDDNQLTIMRRKDKEIKDQNIIEEILRKSEVCRIAMIDGDIPYLVPLNYGYSNNALYIHSSSLGRKIEVLKKNNLVCFEIEYDSEIVKGPNSCDWTTKYRSIIGYANVEIINDFEEKKKGLDILMSHCGKVVDNVYNDKYVEFIVILKLNIESLTAKQSGDWD